MNIKRKPYLERIIKLRKLKEMSQAQVAEWLGLDTSAYGKIENGKTVLTVDRAYQLANVFEVPITDIINTSDAEFIDSIKPQLNEPQFKYNKRNSPNVANICINIGMDTKNNSPAADKFLKRLGQLLMDSEIGSTSQSGDETEPGQ